MGSRWDSELSGCSVSLNKEERVMGLDFSSDVSLGRSKGNLSIGLIGGWIFIVLLNRKET